MPNIGKIASLPKEIRDQANDYLTEGKTEAEIADWLNKVIYSKRELYEKRQGEEPINQQNVSNWRKSGYAQAQAEKKATTVVEQILEGDGAAVMKALDAADKLAIWLIAKLTADLMTLEAAEHLEEAERRKHVYEIISALVPLRRGNHAKAWIEIEARRLELALQRYADEKEQRSSEGKNDGDGKHRGLSMEAMDQIERAAKLL